MFERCSVWLSEWPLVDSWESVEINITRDLFVVIRFVCLFFELKCFICLRKWKWEIVCAAICLLQSSNEIGGNVSDFDLNILKGDYDVWADILRLTSDFSSVSILSKIEEMYKIPTICVPEVWSVQRNHLTTSEPKNCFAETKIKSNRFPK